ncbi:MAG TPA: hypothetical protein VF475_09055 [Sphingobium sp.]
MTKPVRERLRARYENDEEARHPVRRRARTRARLIPELRRAHKLWSVRIAAFGAVLLAVWPELPAEVRADLPYSNQIGAAVLVLTLIARVTKQGKSS